MHLKGFCNVAWAASIVRWSAEHETDIVTYLAFTYIKSCNFWGGVRLKLWTNKAYLGAGCADFVRILPRHSMRHKTYDFGAAAADLAVLWGDTFAS